MAPQLLPPAHSGGVEGTLFCFTEVCLKSMPTLDIWRTFSSNRLDRSACLVCVFPVRTTGVCALGCYLEAGLRPATEWRTVMNKSALGSADREEKESLYSYYATATETPTLSSLSS